MCAQLFEDYLVLNFEDPATTRNTLNRDETSRRRARVILPGQNFNPKTAIDDLGYFERKFSLQVVIRSAS